MLIEKAEHLPVGGAVGGIGRQRPGPPRDGLMAFELVEHQAVRIDPAAELLREHAAPGTDRFPLIDADGAPCLRMHEPAQRVGPVMIFDRGEHRAQVIVGPPIVVVEISDIAAVGEIGQNATQHAAVIGRVQAAVPHRCRIAGIDDIDAAMGGTLGADRFDETDVAVRPVDADQNLDAARRRLPEHRLQRLFHGRADDGRHDHGNVGRPLQIVVRIRIGFETGRCHGLGR